MRTFFAPKMEMALKSKITHYEVLQWVGECGQQKNNRFSDSGVISSV